MRLLTFTNLYPSLDRPRHGIFVEERLRQIADADHVDAEVVALRPRNPFAAGTTPGESPYDSEETRHGIRVKYLGVPTLPLVSNWIDPLLWARASRDIVSGIIAGSRDQTILDAHYLYPDGVAAVLIGRRLGIPVVMTARGSDVNIKCENLVMRRWVHWAGERCASIITVSEALATRLRSLGVAADNVHVLPNGVDLEKFRPLSSDPARFGDVPNGLVLLSAGHLLEGKGHHIAIEALKELPGATLLIVGEGPEQDALRRLSERLGLSARVRFLGYVPHEQMAGVYSSADFTILASAHEGMPNVVLESLACGTRVIATAVGGVGEVITSDVAGSMMQQRRAGAVVDCVHGLRKREHDRRDTREFAERFGWRDTIRKQVTLYERILAKSDGSVRVAADEIA